MKIFTIALIGCLIVSSVVYSQTQVPIIQFQKAFGSSEAEYGYSIVNTTDGGYVVASIVTGSAFPNCYTGFPIVLIMKLNSSGDTVWQRCLEAGRNSASEIVAIKNTPDGGFIVVTSSSKTHFPGYHGGSSDVYVAKLNASGVVQWQKTYGGSAAEQATDITLATDGGYVFVAHTLSNDGDVSGNGYGDADIWIVNLDEWGNIRWQKRYGGPFPDRVDSRLGPVAVIRQTREGGYIFLAQTGPTSQQMANENLYLVKLTAGGDVTWQREIGDSLYDDISADIRQTADGGYVLLYTDHVSSGFNVAVTRLNVDGTTRWSKKYGARIDAKALLIDSDGGFIIAATVGPTSGIPGVQGFIDAWIFKIKDDPGGELVWASVPWGGLGSDGLEKMVFNSDGDLVLTGACSCELASGIPGSAGLFDIWFVKTAPANIIKGNVFIDNNLNGIRDAGDVNAKNFLVRSQKTGVARESLTNNGSFQNIIDTGTITTTIVLNNLYYKTLPASPQSVFNTFNNKDSFDFALQPIPGNMDYGVSLIPSRLRPGFNFTQKMQVYNDGSEILTNREAIFIKSGMTFLDATPQPTRINGDTIRWMIPLLYQNDSINITINLKVDAPPVVNLGDVIVLKAAIDSSGDVKPSNNRAVLYQMATGAFDPNDKMESSGRYITRSDVENGKELTYTIRFQNTGTDTAFNVVVRDTLHANLDWTTLKMVAASHRFALNVKDGNKLSWKFNNIHLPDSNVNEQASHGFITYRIKAKNTVMPGDTLKNSASIYFDFNEPVQTNQHLTLVRSNLPDLITPSVQGVSGIYCSSQGVQKGKINNLPASASGINVVATLDANAIAIATDSTFNFDVSTLSAGNHALEVTYTKSDVTEIVRINFRVSVAINPNVNVSANTTSVVNVANPVIINAINVAGGGRNPLYTFGKDRNFNTSWQAEGSSNVLSISPTALQNGDNWIYIRMKSSSACVTSQYNTDSIKITRQLPALNQPLITGINNAYCINNGLQKAKLANYPAQGSGTVVTVKLNSNEIALAADTSFSFNVTTLGAGAHLIEVIYTNLSGTKTTQVNFNVTAAVIPDVNITASARNVSNVTDSIVITAFNAAGGGATPLFTFARNNTFTDILRAEATAAAIKIHSSAFKLGENWMYVRMKTSANCYTSQTATDSVLITRFGLKGLVDPDYPEQLIMLAPNPYKSQVTLYGLSSTKSYTIKLYNLQGKILQQSKVSNRTTATFRWPGYAAGNYMLSVYDETNKRLIGTISLVKQ